LPPKPLDGIHFKKLEFKSSAAVVVTQMRTSLRTATDDLSGARYIVAITNKGDLHV